MSMLELPQSHQNDQHYLVKVNQNFKCVCELCNCGRHKCPKQRLKGDYDTSYKQHYREFTIVPQISKPAYQFQPRHYNPQTLKTNYQDEYPVKPQSISVSSSRLQNIGREIMRPSQAFVGSTSYQQEYKPYQIQTYSNQPEGALIGSKITQQSNNKFPLKFEGESAYKSSFHQIPIPKISRYKHPQYKSKSPFVGQSSYKSQFPTYKMQYSYQKPSPQSNSKQVKFDGSSTYNSHYRTFKIEPQKSNQIGCHLDSLQIPSTNYLNNSQHIYFDQNSKQFI